MVATKRFTVGILLTVLFALILSFAMPISADAAGIPNVNFDSKGNMTVSGDGFTQSGGKSAWESLIEKYRGFIIGISGIAAITMVVIFIFQFLKLGASAGNPQARSQALVGVLWSGIAAAGLGAVTLIVGLFYRSIGG